MKKTLSSLVVLGLTLARVFAADEPQPPAADALLQRILAEPGQYSQMCGGLFVGGAVPLPIYGFVGSGELHLSAANLATLRTRRAEIIPALNEHLAKLRVRIEGAAEAPKSGTFTTLSTLGTPLYEIVLGLDAVETLPMLLRLEDQIDGELAKEAPAAATSKATACSVRAGSVPGTRRQPSATCSP